MRRSGERPLGLGLLTLASCLLSGTSSTGAEPFPDGPEVVVGQAYEGGSIAADTAGNFVIAWRVGRVYDEIRAQRVDATGELQGTPILVNQIAPGNTWYGSTADVATTGGSDFVVVWGEHGRRFDSSGEPLTNEFETGPSVYTYCPSSNECQFSPAVAGSPSGEFVVVWTAGHEFDGEQYPCVTEARHFEPLAETQGPVRLVGYGCWVKEASVARGDAMEVIVRGSCADYGLRGKLYIERFDLLGNSLGSWVNVNPDQEYTERGVVAMTSAGDSVVAWRGRDTWSDPPGVFAQRFDDELAPQGARISVASVTTQDFSPSNNRRRASVARNDTGDFVVVWTHLDQGKPWLFGRRYHPDGTPDGEAFLIHDASDDSEWSMRGIDVAMDEDGNFMVVWQLPPEQTNDSGTFMTRRYCGPLRLSGPSALEVCEGQPAALEVVATGRRPFEYQWWRDGMALFDGGSVTGAMAPLLQIDPVTVADAGSYEVEVLDSCATQTELLSQSASLSVLTVPGEVLGLDVALSEDGTTLLFTWADFPGATDYTVTEDAVPDGDFSTVIGTAASGAMGLTAPVPEGDRYFLVAGSNLCGAGT